MWWSRMNNVILGSGIVGLLAKFILGSNWKIVPFYKSRFFTFSPPLDDNFIIRDEKLDQFVADLQGVPRCPLFVYRCAWSIRGILYPHFDKRLCLDWLTKIFGSQVPTQSEIYLTNRMNLSVYDLRVNEIYQNLLRLYLPELKQEKTKGEISEIGEHYLIRNGVKEEFDNAVSTIPLDILCKLTQRRLELPAKTLHYLHVETSNLDFEGHNQALVVDDVFTFYKVTNIAPRRYMFYCLDKIDNPGLYFRAIIPNDFDILDGTSIERVLPVGEMPKLDWTEAFGIFCVGSCAQHDWCMDVGSCVLRLLRYAQRGHKPAKPRSL